MSNIELLKYPIGKFEQNREYTNADTRLHIEILEEFPQKLRNLTSQLTASQLDKTYRIDGWTLRQVIHHLADSHTNMFIRVRLALTEENPSVTGYNEAAWAKLPDHSLPIRSSLQIIEGLHERMVSLLKSLDGESLNKTYFHNGYQKLFKIQEVVALYAWHSEHHYQHILRTLK